MTSTFSAPRIGCCLMLGIAFTQAQAAEPPPVDHSAGRYMRFSYDDCYYYGRCSADDLRRLRERLQRIERVTPQAPADDSAESAVRLSDVAPTPVEQIQPEYRDASRLREEFRDGAAAREAPDSGRNKR